MLEARHLNAGYGRARVLFDVNLRAQAGEVVVLLGRNGAGKSTLLKALMGLVARFSGEVRFGEARIERLEPYEIARLVPEHQRLFKCCVDLDHSATNTIGNAIETRRWVEDRGFKSVIVVTANFHMPRAMAELGHELPAVDLVPYAVVSDRVKVDDWWDNPSTARLLFLEYLKYIVARVRMALPPSLA